MSEFIRDESTGNRDYAYPGSGVEMGEKIDLTYGEARQKLADDIQDVWCKLAEAINPGLTASIGQLREAVAALTERVEANEKLGEVLECACLRMAKRIEQLERPSMTGSVQGLDAVFTVTPWPRFLELMEESSVG